METKNTMLKAVDFDGTQARLEVHFKEYRKDGTEYSDINVFTENLNKNIQGRRKCESAARLCVASAKSYFAALRLNDSILEISAYDLQGNTY